MFTEEFQMSANAAKAKVSMLKKNPLGYFALSMLAGMFIGFGILIAFSCGGYLAGAAYTKIVMGLSFGVALSLVVMAGGELFTGSNLVMASGLIKKTITAGEAIKLWVVCWLGNLVGAIILAFVYYYSGLANGAIGEFMAAGALAKMTAPVSQLFCRAILCNILVCLAVWCGFRCKNEVAKLIMIFWCLYVFITCGFEHSIANMTLFTEAMLNPCGQAVSMTGYITNLVVVTLGNMVGGIIFVAVPYALAAKEEK